MPTDANTLIPSLWATLQQPAPTNTWPLGSPSLAWSNLYLGAGGIPVLDPTSGIIGYYPPTTAETAAASANGVTLRPVFPYGAMRRYGMDPTGVADSHPGLLAATASASDVYDDYPGGGLYLFNSETVIAGYPITIRGQARGQAGNQVDVSGTIFKLATAAGAGAACLRTTAFAATLRIQNIGFAFQTITSGQIAMRFSLDLRYSIVEGCLIAGGGTNSTIVGIQCDGGGTYSGGVVIRDNFFSNPNIGIWLKGNCTTFKIYGNEFYGYSGAAGAVAGYGIECDYPVVEPVISSNYFEGFQYGIYSNGASQIKQIGNDYQVCTQSFNWIKTSYSVVTNQSVGETGVGGLYTTTDGDQNNLMGRLGWLATGGAIQSTRGFQEGNGATLRAYNAGYPQTIAFAAGNFTGNGSMTWTVISAGQSTFTFAIIGKTLTVWFNIGGTVGGTPNTALQIAIPGGFAAAAQTSIGQCSVFNNAVWSISACQVNPSGTVIQIFTTASGSVNWTAGSVQVAGQIQIQVG